MDEMQKKIHLRDEQIASMEVDIQDLKMIASVSENTKQEAIDNLTQRHQEELESLRKAMEESHNETRTQMMQEFERERRRWSMKFQNTRKNVEDSENDGTGETSNATVLSSQPQADEFQRSAFDSRLNKSVEDPHQILLDGSILITNPEIQDLHDVQAAGNVNFNRGGPLDCLLETDRKEMSEEQWSNMLREINTLRSKLANVSAGEKLISTPKQKHANLFEDDEEMTAEIEKLKKSLKALDIENKELKLTNQSLEDSIKFAAQDAQKQFHNLSEKCRDYEKLVTGLREEQMKARAQDVNIMLNLKKQITKYFDELQSFKKERERITELQEKHHRILLKEAAPKSNEALHSLFSACQKELSHVRAEKETIESKLRSEVYFMEERLKAEQSSKSQMESSLASELHDARGEILNLKSAKDRLETTLKRNSDLERDLEKTKSSYEALRAKSDEIIQGLRKKQFTEMKAREEAERALADTKHKLRSLHGALETSEQVQRDFVRLSQSLQVELEQVKQQREMERKSDAGSVDSTEALHTPTNLDGGTSDAPSVQRDRAVSAADSETKNLPES